MNSSPVERLDTIYKCTTLYNARVKNTIQTLDFCFTKKRSNGSTPTTFNTSKYLT